MAHFYNNIETQIVRSQKPLLLDFALAFEQLATNPRAQSTADKGKGGLTLTLTPTLTLTLTPTLTLTLTLTLTPTLNLTPTLTPTPTLPLTLTRRQGHHLVGSQPARGVHTAAARCGGAAHL